MRLDIAKFEKGDDIAILLSPSYGAGWSTWNYSELAYDKRVVEFWIEHHEDVDYINALSYPNIYSNSSEIRMAANRLFGSWGYEDIYWGGFEDIKLTWIRKGEVYRIVEYDGSEHIEMFNDANWLHDAGWLIAR